MTETRSYQVMIETREKDGEFKITGRAIPYDTTTELWSNFYESIQPGAVRETIKNDRQYLLWQHDSSIPLADTKSGTLTLTDKDDGLYFEADLSTNDETKNYYSLIKKGIVDEMSFGFTIKSEEFTEEGDKTYRTITEIGKLFELSMVNFPAYTQGTFVESKKMVEKEQQRILSLRAQSAKNKVYLRRKRV